MDKPAEKRSVFEITDDEVVISYGNEDTDFREVGYGHTNVFTHGVPSFKRFFLHPWAHKQVFTKGAQAYYMFPWQVCYARLSPWATTLEPLIMAPADHDLEDAQDLIGWIRQRRIDLGLLKVDDADARTV